MVKKCGLTQKVGMYVQSAADAYHQTHLKNHVSVLHEKKNGAARLDPWEILVLLALKIPFHFISLRRLENYLHFV